MNSGSKPKLACEVAADRVLAGRLSDSGDVVAECASHELAPGSVVPDLIDTNLRQRSAVYKTIEDTLSRIGGRSRDVIAVLPDAAVRVVLLDFDALPTNREEAEGVVRFRLKKSLPFDVDKARVTWERLAEYYQEADAPDKELDLLVTKRKKEVLNGLAQKENRLKKRLEA